MTSDRHLTPSKTTRGWNGISWREFWMRLAAIAVLAFPALMNVNRLASGQLKLRQSVIEWDQQPVLFTVYAGVFLSMLLISSALGASLVRAMLRRAAGKPGGFRIRRTGN